MPSRQTLRLGWLQLGLIAAAICGIAVPAQAELVYLTTGRSMSVKGHRIEGETIVFELRGGGEMTMSRVMVERVAPDEVPYPEPSSGSPEIGPAVEQALPVLPRTEFAPLIERAAAAHGVDARLVQAVIQVESNYRRGARSPKGAVGLMQLMPATARQYGVRGARLYDPASNIDAGVRHLKSLLERLPLSLALAAYNAGEAAVQRFSGIPPYPETRSYVARVLTLLGTR